MRNISKVCLPRLPATNEIYLTFGITVRSPEVIYVTSTPFRSQGWSQTVVSLLYCHQQQPCFMRSHFRSSSKVIRSNRCLLYKTRISNSMFSVFCLTIICEEHYSLLWVTKIMFFWNQTNYNVQISSIYVPYYIVFCAHEIAKCVAILYIMNLYRARDTPMQCSCKNIFLS